MGESTFQEVPLSDITPNAMNPRRTFKGPEFDELVESIRQKGVIEPIMVRPFTNPPSRLVNDKNSPTDSMMVSYEIVFGERRFRASCEVAGDKQHLAQHTIPAIIRELSDDEAFDLMMIENLQREELNELEEARGFQLYLERKGEDALEDLAGRTGIKPSYIRRRVKVLGLPKYVLKAWEKGDLRYGHLEQLLRLDTKKEVKEYFENHLFEWTDEPVSVKELKRQIDAQSPKLSGAYFDLEKEGCLTCRSNSDTQRKLFAQLDGLEETCCLKPACFKQKQNNWLTSNWYESEYRKKFKTDGFRFYDSVHHNDYQGIHNKTRPACLMCGQFVTLLREDCTPLTERACLDPACYNKTYLKTSGSKSPELLKPARYHGTEFREKFYQQRLPERYREIDPEDLKNYQTILLSLLKSNSGLRQWFIEETAFKPEDDDHPDYYGHFVPTETLFEKIAAMTLDQVKEILKEASIRVVMQAEFGAEGRRLIADNIGIDLSREWTITEEYLQKKRIKEILELGESLGIFKDEKATTFLFEKLLKKRNRFDTCSKKELIRVFMESGVDLSGKVPEEILFVDTPTDAIK